MKTYIRTSDIFDMADSKKRMNALRYCRDQALNLGLICQCHLDGTDTRLYMAGPKKQFIMYYIKTISQSESLCGHIKRIISIIFT